MTEEEMNAQTIGDERTAADDVMTAKAANQMTEDISEFIGSFSEDYMKNSFGNHTIVTLSRDGSVSNDDYGHE